MTIFQPCEINHILKVTENTKKEQRRRSKYHFVFNTSLFCLRTFSLVLVPIVQDPVPLTFDPFGFL